MQAKGYTQRDVLQAEVQKAYAEGIGNMGPAISAGGGSSIMGDMLGLGVGMAAASTVMPQISGMMQGMNMPMQTPGFGENVGMNSPVNTQMQSWDCACGQKNVIGNFCNNCGTKRPETGLTWDCSCGQKSIVGNFCNNCGKKRGE